MAVTIGSFISALSNPHVSMATLSELAARGDDSGSVVVNCSTNFAQAVVEWERKSYILSMPLRAQGLDLAQNISVKLRMLRSKLLHAFRVLPREMSYIDPRGQEQFVDLLLEEIPCGVSLAKCCESYHPQQLFDAIDTLEHELTRLDIRHNNLTAENIIVGDDGALYPIRFQYITFGEQCLNQCNALRDFVAQCHNIVLPTTPKRVNPLAKEPNCAMYGYKYVGNPFEGMCVAQSHKGYGYIGLDNQEIIKPQYLWAGDIREGRAEVETEPGLGLIDATGRYIIEPRYQIIEFDPDTGLTRAKLNQQWTTFDYEGRPLK